MLFLSLLCFCCRDLTRVIIGCRTRCTLAEDGDSWRVTHRTGEDNSVSLVLPSSEINDGYQSETCFLVRSRSLESN